MPITVDFTDVRGFDPVPGGQYLVEVVSVKEGRTGQQSKTPGSQKLDAQFKVVGGEYDNRRLFDTWVLSGPGAYKIHSFLEAAMGSDSFEAGQRHSLEPEELVGVRVIATVEVDPNRVEDGGSGKPRNAIKSYSSATADNSELVELFGG